MWVEESVWLGRPAEINEDNELKTAAAYFDDAWKKTRKRVQDEKKKTLKAQKEANQLKQDLVDAFNTNQQLQHQLDEAEFRLNCKEEECSKLEEHVKFLQGSKDQLAKQLFDSLKRDCQNCAALKESNNTARKDLANAINSAAGSGPTLTAQSPKDPNPNGGPKTLGLTNITIGRSKLSRAFRKTNNSEPTKDPVLQEFNVAFDANNLDDFDPANDDGSRLKLLVEKTATCEENATFLNPGYPEEVPEFDNFDGMTYDDTVQDKDYVPNIESQSSSSTESSSAHSTPKKQKREVRRSRTFFLKKVPKDCNLTYEDDKQVGDKTFAVKEKSTKKPLPLNVSEHRDKSAVEMNNGEFIEVVKNFPSDKLAKDFSEQQLQRVKDLSKPYCYNVDGTDVYVKPMDEMQAVPRQRFQTWSGRHQDPQLP